MGRAKLVRRRYLRCDSHVWPAISASRPRTIDLADRRSVRGDLAGIRLVPPTASRSLSRLASTASAWSAVRLASASPMPPGSLRRRRRPRAMSSIPRVDRLTIEVSTARRCSRSGGLFSQPVRRRRGLTDRPSPRAVPTQAGRIGLGGLGDSSANDRLFPGTCAHFSLGPEPGDNSVSVHHYGDNSVSVHHYGDNSVSVHHYCFPCIKSVSWIHGKTSKTDRR